MSETGARLGKYRLVRPLHIAEAGEAHLATMIGIKGFKKEVVLWMFRASPERAATLIGAVTMEAKLAASLSDANIAQVLDLDLIDGSCVLRGADGPVTQRDIAALANARPRLAAVRSERSFAEYLMRTSTALQMCGALFEALDRLELALDAIPPVTPTR
jgi:hypothetical protein